MAKYFATQILRCLQINTIRFLSDADCEEESGYGNTALNNSFAEYFGDGFFATVYMQFVVNIFEVGTYRIKRYF